MNAEERRLMSLAHSLHEGLSAVPRETLTLAQVYAILEKAELLAALLIHEDTEVKVSL